MNRMAAYDVTVTKGRSFPKKHCGGQSHPTSDIQQFYCEACKISCMGRQTYKDHVEGKKHKKKEALQKGEDRTLSKSWVSFRCEMCNVTCTGKDTYESHILGSRHQKTANLMKKLIKSVPETSAVTAPGEGSNSAAPAATVGGPAVPTRRTALAAEDMQRVGENYVEEKRNAAGKVVQYICKLCHCKFNDQSAKNTHIRGRKHHLQYKLKMNPELVVDVTPNQIHHERRIEQDRMMRAHSGPPRDDIYPDEAQLNAVEKLVAMIERALKGVSDQFAAKCV